MLARQFDDIQPSPDTTPRVPVNKWCAVGTKERSQGAIVLMQRYGLRRSGEPGGSVIGMPGGTIAHYPPGAMRNEQPPLGHRGNPTDMATGTKRSYEDGSWTDAPRPIGHRGRIGLGPSGSYT